MAASPRGFPRRPGAAALGAALLVAASCAAPPAAQGKPVAPPPASAPTLGKMLCLDDSRFPLSGTGSDPAVAQRAWHIEQLEALGVTHVRHDLRWDQLEPVKGTFHWERFDPGIDAVTGAGLDLIGILDYGVPWATTKTPTDPMYPPDNPMDYAHFAGAVAGRYKGKIHTYEIWNEENSGFRFWKPKPDPAAYADLLHDAYGAIHGADPNAEVVYGSLFYLAQGVEGAVPFLQASFAARPDLANDFDAFGFHPYPPYPPEEPPESDSNGAVPIDKITLSLQTVLAAHGAAKRPLLATEYGWADYLGLTQTLQADYLAREAIWLSAEHVPLACWFTLVDGPNAGNFPPEDDFGLFNWDKTKNAPSTKKPAWYAMKTLTSKLGDLAVSRRLDDALGLGSYAYAFRLANTNGRRWADALWTYDDGLAQDVTVPEPHGATLSVIDALGHKVPFTRVGDSVKVHITGRPVYILGQLPASP